MFLLGWGFGQCLIINASRMSFGARLEPGGVSLTSGGGKTWSEELTVESTPWFRS